MWILLDQLNRSRRHELLVSFICGGSTNQLQACCWPRMKAGWDLASLKVKGLHLNSDTQAGPKEQILRSPALQHPFLQAAPPAYRGGTVLQAGSLLVPFRVYIPSIPPLARLSKQSCVADAKIKEVWFSDFRTELPRTKINHTHRWLQHIWGHSTGKTCNRAEQMALKWDVLAGHPDWCRQLHNFYP